MNTYAEAMMLFKSYTNALRKNAKYAVFSGKIWKLQIFHKSDFS